MSANKISLNIEKTKLVISESARKVLLSNIKVKLSRKSLYTSNSIKYLGIKIDWLLHWHVDVNSIVFKLDRANGLLIKITIM